LAARVRDLLASTLLRLELPQDITPYIRVLVIRQRKGGRHELELDS